ADGKDAAAKVVGAAVVEVIACHGGDDNVLEPESQGGLGDAFGFIVLECLGCAARYGTKAARAGADVAQDHEGCGAPGVALGPVWAAGVLAHRLETQLAQQLLREEVAVALGQSSLQPGGEAPGSRASIDKWEAMH